MPSLLVSRATSETPTGRTVVCAPAVAKDPGRTDLVNENVTAVAECREVGCFEIKGRIVLRCEGIGHTLERDLVAHQGSVALHHLVRTVSKSVTPGCDDAVGVPCEVVRLALGAASGEVQRAIHPDRDHRRDVRSAVSAHGR